jgi:hypothetical protein
MTILILRHDSRHVLHTPFCHMPVTRFCYKSRFENNDMLGSKENRYYFRKNSCPRMKFGLSYMSAIQERNAKEINCNYHQFQIVDLNDFDASLSVQLAVD